MYNIETGLILGYLLMSCYFFTNWLRFTLRHPSSAPEDKFLSFLVFLITTIFWPIIVPMACLEILKKRKLEYNTAMPILVAALAFSLSFYFG